MTKTAEVSVDDLEGRELDAAVQEDVFGQEVVGYTTCVHVEGSWSIHPASEPNGWACYAETGPVYVSDWCGGDEHHERMRERSRERRQEVAARNGWTDDEVRELEERDETKHWVFGHSTTCLEVVPCYSTDIAAAWGVVEHLRRGDCFVGLDPVFGGGWNVRVFRRPLDGSGWSETQTASADTAPEAICRAALKAVRGAD